ncbi:MAG: bifunctional nuclease family protein [Planctomycetota bacterium]|nr:bifunctional nuclease family protein [Planctomycetota bacterium]
MLVEVELFQVIITEGSPTQSIVLKEKNAQRAFPIFIGYTEAMAIDRKLKEFNVPRPLTHDLLLLLIEGLGGKLEKIVLNALRDTTYYAMLVIRQNGKDVEIDARPSDAIALAVRVGCPIYIEEEVLRQATEGA